VATRTLVLASASPARLAVLRTAGFDPEVLVSGVDEPPFEGGDTRAYVRELAERKARAVVDKVGAGALVIGCDSMLELDGQLMGKPTSAEQALERWQAMRARTGMLLTGHCVIDTVTSTLVADTAVTEVHFGAPSDEELEAYVASGEPLHVAGGFTLDGRSGAYVSGIVGDHGNVLGLSLPLLRALLAQLDVPMHELWV
jgi:septum formation protein